MNLKFLAFKNLNTFIKLWPKVILIIMILPLFCSCGKRIEKITINSFTNPKKIPNGFSKESSFCVIPAKNNNQLFEKEISQKIKTILQDQEYAIKEQKNANYYLTFIYGIKSSTHIINVPKYVPGQEQTIQGNIYGKYGWYGGYTEQSQSTGSIIYVPEEYTFFNKSLFIKVYDADLYRKTKNEDLVWEGSAISCGESSDIRKFIDYLLMSVFRYFGKNTQKNIHLDTYSEDKNVDWLRKTYLNKN